MSSNVCQFIKTVRSLVRLESVTGRPSLWLYVLPTQVGEFMIMNSIQERIILTEDNILSWLTESRHNMPGVTLGHNAEINDKLKLSVGDILWLHSRNRHGGVRELVSGLDNYPNYSVGRLHTVRSYKNSIIRAGPSLW
jgi:hypothetical protein